MDLIAHLYTRGMQISTYALRLTNSHEYIKIDANIAIKWLDAKGVLDNMSRRSMGRH